MLVLTVGTTSLFDEDNNVFLTEGGFELQLEHSLAALSKWESIHEIPFLGGNKKTPEQLASYFECMVVSPNPPGDFLHQLSQENLAAIQAYIDKKMTATWFSEIQPQSRNQETITAELIYYWMTVYHIPFECDRWHLNKLFTLIRVASLKQQKPKKMSRSEQARRMRELNAQRKAQLQTKG